MKINSCEDYRDFVTAQLERIETIAKDHLKHILHCKPPAGATLVLLEVQPTSLWSNSSVVVWWVDQLPDYNEVEGGTDYFITEQVGSLLPFSEAEEERFDHLGIDTVSLEMEAATFWLRELALGIGSENQAFACLQDEPKFLSLRTGKWLELYTSDEQCIKFVPARRSSPDALVGRRL
ncbi:MAG: hypothetical protein MI794_04445 [Pseudomonadales bacterium]|nr:hypothetical protein [Pseudomonadales bacterium]